MTNNEFKRLKRADLIEIIYQMQENEERYKAAIANMRTQLEERKLQISNAGSIAEAALAVSGVYQTAQEAADLYLEQIRRMHEEAAAELAAAKKEAKQIIEAAKRAGE